MLSELYKFDLMGKFSHKKPIESSSNFWVSPSPSPVPSANFKSGDSMNSPEEVKACDMALNKCKIDEYNITACVPSVGNGLKGSLLIVLNDGENSLKLNITVHPANETLEQIVIPAHQVKKVNMTSNMGGSSSISVNAGNGVCTIQLGASVPQASYTTYLTPVNGTYILFVTVLFIGGTWACCKLVKRERHLDGVPYRELEMGHQESKFSLNVETGEGWNESWDDDWDEEKAV
ncbi:uncharacterized protein Fot_00633 [Forsythia ovata]|uniref:DUF7356 domain-containing protein n=1 Tax=Forsythia ovata TaxID=205694 RepID=A0ABD1X1R6_9LAMI